MDPAAVELALATLPSLPHVDRLAFELGRDGGGQKALRLWVIVRDDAPSLAWSPEARERLRLALRKVLRDAGLRSAWPYIAFRSAAEQAALDAVAGRASADVATSAATDPAETP